MALEQYFEEALAHSGLCESDDNALRKWESAADMEIDSGVSSSSGFECNICLDSVHEPVVTLCGHLYCWSCIYKWLQFRSSPTEDEQPSPQRCPVCKADVSPASLVPLYGRGLATKPSEAKAHHLGLVIPKRPTAPGCGVETPRSPSRTISPRFRHESHSHEPPMHFMHDGSYRSSPVSTQGSRRLNSYDPTAAMLGETVYAMVFGNSIANFYNYPNSYNFTGSTSPRIRRRIMQADQSLGRMCLFLLCCAFLCLLLF